MTTLLSSGDDDIPLWLKEYYSMDPYLRSEYLDAIGMTRDALRAYERRRRAARAQRSSTAASQAGPMSGQEGNVSSVRRAAVVVLRLPKATKRVEVLLDAGAGDGPAGSGRYTSAPPSRGSGATGPGRRRSDGRRRGGWRAHATAPLVRIVITLREN